MKTEADPPISIDTLIKSLDSSLSDIARPIYVGQWVT